MTITTRWELYVIGGCRRYVAVAGGFAEVLLEQIRVLAGVSGRAEEIHVEAARRAHDRVMGAVDLSPARRQSEPRPAALARAGAHK